MSGKHFHMAFLLTLMSACTSPKAGQAPTPTSGISDTAEARRLFEENIDAIHKRNRPGYLATYLHSAALGRNGPSGLELGYDNWSALSDTSWPDTLVARNLRILPIAPGVVYGTYCYTVTQDKTTSSGVSERIFVKTPAGWKIAVTTAFGLPAATPPECK
jgi:hypothetical protein